MEFICTAMDMRGEQIRQELKADNQDSAISKLQEQGLVVLSITSVTSKSREVTSAPLSGMLIRKKIKSEQIVALTRELSIMISTGVPIVDALDLLGREETHPVIKQAMMDFKRDINEGKGLADSMMSYRNIFPDLYIRMVRTAEMGSDLDETLTRAADHIQKVHEMRNRISSATAYPKILAVITFGVILFLLLFLIPRFKELFTRMNAPMPIHTRILIEASDILRGHWWNTPLILIGLAVIGYTVQQFPQSNRLLAQVMLRMPIAGEMIRKIEVTRFLQTLGSLLNTGVPLLASLEAAEQAVQHTLFINALVIVRKKVAEGQSMAVSLTETNVFPKSLCQIVAVGEKSGRMSEVMVRMASFYEAEVDTKLKSLSTILEPVMIVVLAVIVGLVGISIIEPIYSLMDGIK